MLFVPLNNEYAEQVYNSTQCFLGAQYQNVFLPLFYQKIIAVYQNKQKFLLKFQDWLCSSFEVSASHLPDKSYKSDHQASNKAGGHVCRSKSYKVQFHQEICPQS